MYTIIPCVIFDVLHWNYTKNLFTPMSDICSVRPRSVCRILANQLMLASLLMQHVCVHINRPKHCCIYSAIYNISYFHKLTLYGEINQNSLVSPLFPFLSREWQ